MADEKERPVLNKDECRTRAEVLVKEQSTMTLATSGGDEAWAAPVYYTFRKSSFYFFSDPSSRHILESLKSGQASAAIYADSTSWEGIRGIQMSGKIAPVPVGLEAVDAIRGYLKKFSFTKEFFQGGQAIDLEAFTKRFRVKLYRLSPKLLYYMDNSIRFGFREELQL